MQIYAFLSLSKIVSKACDDYRDNAVGTLSYFALAFCLSVLILFTTTYASTYIISIASIKPKTLCTNYIFCCHFTVIMLQMSTQSVA